MEVNREEWYSSDAQASVVVMDPATGQVKAMVGGRGEKTGSLTLNRATSAVRQPGSTIKVVGEYAAALDSGAITLGTVYDDAPYAYQDGSAIRNAGGTYGGRTTVRQAIANSDAPSRENVPLSVRQSSHAPCKPPMPPRLRSSTTTAQKTVFSRVTSPSSVCWT